ncbi:hypothetical protein FA13DRAFT_1749528, partial [Coprinellus micaceus]
MGASRSNPSDTQVWAKRAWAVDRYLSKCCIERREKSRGRSVHAPFLLLTDKLKVGNTPRPSSGGLQPSGRRPSPSQL